jgi:2-keto-4-pentenoate hydratase/2-oxohepta-3-ene-1,7-dioic acid hydratase in catechol pathway
MKIVRYTTGRKAEYGIWNGEIVQSLAGTPYRHLKTTNRYHQLRDLRLLPPCTPSKIVALGLNYRSHAEEFNLHIPAEPLIFLKPSTSVIGPEDKIIYPESSERVDYEGELGVVIGRRAWRVPEEESGHYILGYTCVNDVTARDLQESDRQWSRAKGFDTFAPIGPCIETELDPSNLPLETYLNGELKQQTSTSDLIFSVPRLVSFISHVMTLLPGDVIATGTTSGIGPMQPGDTVEVKIEQIGTLRNYVVSPPSH